MKTHSNPVSDPTKLPMGGLTAPTRHGASRWLSGFPMLAHDENPGAAPPPAPPSGDPAAPPTPPAGDPPGDKGKGDETAFMERLNRARAADQKKMLKDLGVETIEEAQQKLNRLGELEREKLSEKEKLEADVNAWKKKYEDAEREKQTLTVAQKAAERDRMIERAMTETGVETGFDDVVSRLVRDHLSENFSDKEPTAEDVKAYLAALKKDEKKGLFFTAVKKPAATGGDTPPPAEPPSPPGKQMSKADVDALSDEEYERKLQEAVASLR